MVKHPDATRVSSTADHTTCSTAVALNAGLLATRKAAPLAPSALEAHDSLACRQSPQSRFMALASGAISSDALSAG